MSNEPRSITDNLDELLSALPPDLAAAISHDERLELLEIVLDLGRRPEARLPGRFKYLRETPIERAELQYVEAKIGIFGTDNRAGIPATLHRISAIRNRRGEIVGLTMRVGRAVSGIVDILRDIIGAGESLLVMGRPGLGKTTLLREIARVLADEVDKRVVVVDTSNEIAGDGDVPHPAIGRARRMQVARVSEQHDVMIEAVENHMPEVVIIDEIGRIEETMAARTIAERGVQLIATVHGNTLDNLLANPTLSDLIGGIQAVTLSDEEARRRGTQKTVLERKAPPTFSVVVEMIERDQIAVRRPVSDVIDALLRGHPAPPELRWRDENGAIHSEQPAALVPPSMAQQAHAARSARSAPNRNDRGRTNPNRNGRTNRRGPRDQNGPGGPGGSGDAADVGAFSVAARYSEMAGGKPHNVVPAAPHSVAPPTTAALTYLPALAVVADADQYDDEDENGIILPHERADLRINAVQAPVDLSRIHSLYPFGISRSRLARAVKHLGLPLELARRWQDADAIFMLGGSNGLQGDSSLLREPREAGRPILAVEGSTYADIVLKLNELYAGGNGEVHLTPRDLALREAQSAAQRVLARGEPVDLRPQTRQMRRVQHQLAARFHLRSYSIGHEPARRVRYLPGLSR